MRLFVIVSCLMLSTAYAAEREHGINIEWSYDSQGQEISGFNLYKEGVKVCSSNEDTRAMDCTILSEDGIHGFTLTAVDSEDSESPHSPIYNFELVGSTYVLVAPTIIKIESK